MMRRLTIFQASFRSRSIIARISAHHSDFVPLINVTSRL